MVYGVFTFYYVFRCARARQNVPESPTFSFWYPGHITTSISYDALVTYNNRIKIPRSPPSSPPVVLPSSPPCVRARGSPSAPKFPVYRKTLFANRPAKCQTCESTLTESGVGMSQSQVDVMGVKDVLSRALAFLI